MFPLLSHVYSVFFILATKVVKHTLKGWGIFFITADLLSLRKKENTAAHWLKQTSVTF
jgi:hypothetical protein